MIETITPAQPTDRIRVAICATRFASFSISSRIEFPPPRCCVDHDAYFGGRTVPAQWSVGRSGRLPTLGQRRVERLLGFHRKRALEHVAAERCDRSDRLVGRDLAVHDDERRRVRLEQITNLLYELALDAHVAELSEERSHGSADRKPSHRD